jgi:rhodanese-related sulfurtransferase
MNIRGVVMVAGVVIGLSGAALATQTAPPMDTSAPKPATHLVEAAEAKQLIADKKVVVLDVRTPGEFADGHLAGAINLDFRDKDFAAKVAKLDKNQPYLVHCAAGVRSAKACDIMGPMQFKTLYDLKGGLSAWQKAGYKLEK